MAVGATGMDLKKLQWRSAGRPVVCSVHGATGDDTWFTVACAVLDADRFNERVRSLLRAHDGRGGDPRRASRWLDREPTDDEWNATLAVLRDLDVHVRDERGVPRVVQPHLLRVAGGPAPAITSHTLKQSKIALYHAMLLHTDYIVEAGAHAGSQLERMSVGGAETQIRQMRPTGLQVALHYARASRNQHSVLEVEALAFRTMRAWLADVGLTSVPRTNGWAHLTRWVGERACRSGNAPLAPPALFAMRESTPEADAAGGSA